MDLGVRTIQREQAGGESSLSFRRYIPGYLIIISGLLRTVTADPVSPTAEEIFAGLDAASSRRNVLLKEYSGARQYTLQNLRFGKAAAVAVLMSYRQVEGERYTVVSRSGSDSLNSIIDKVLASEADESLQREKSGHQITSANYRLRLLGSETASGRRCYVVELSPKIKNRFLIVGKEWVDVDSYGLVRIEGQFAASISILVGAPRIIEEFVEVGGFWLPGHVRSISSSFLLGPTELDISFSNYHLDRDPAIL